MRRDIVLPMESLQGQSPPASLPGQPVQNASRLQHTLQCLDFCIEQAGTEDGITLGTALDRLGGAGFCFVSLLLAAPFIQPVSLGPYTMASGITFIAIGWQMGRGREHMILPEKANGLHLRGKAWVAILRFCRRLLVWLAKFTRPRLTAWVDGAEGTKRVGWLIFVGGILLTIPWANLPFNNTVPALMIFFAALAWLERDGLMAVMSIIWGVLTLVYFAVTAGVILWAGTNAIDWVKGWLR
ncbi:MAG TPA: exopolysaccharide biosynthesis protein [Chthoniobacterales bacterium]